MLQTGKQVEVTACRTVDGRGGVVVRAKFHYRDQPETHGWTSLKNLKEIGSSPLGRSRMQNASSHQFAGGKWVSCPHTDTHYIRDLQTSAWQINLKTRYQRKVRRQLVRTGTSATAAVAAIPAQATAPAKTSPVDEQHALRHMVSLRSSADAKAPVRHNLPAGSFARIMETAPGSGGTTWYRISSVYRLQHEEPSHMTSKDEASDDDDDDDDDDEDGQVNADDNAELQLATTGDAIWTVQDAQGNDVQFEAARCKAIEAAFASGSKEYRFSACFDGQHSFDYTISLEPSPSGKALLSGKAFYQRNDQTGKRRLVSRFRVVGGEMVPSLSLSRVDFPSQVNPRLSATLTEICLEEFASNFVELGANGPEDLFDVEDADLDKMGMKTLQKRYRQPTLAHSPDLFSS